MAKRILKGRASGGNPVGKGKTYSGGSTFRGPLLAGSRRGGGGVPKGNRGGTRYLGGL
jgi:hypothetical protein